MKEVLIDFKKIDEKKYRFFLYNFLDKKNLNINPDFIKDDIKYTYKEYKNLRKIKKNLIFYIFPKIERNLKKNFNYAFWKIVLYPWIDSLVNRVFILWKTVSKNKKLFQKVYEYPGEIFIENSFIDLNYNNNLDLNVWLISEIILFKNKKKIKKKKISIKKENVNYNNKATNLYYILFNIISKFLPSNKIIIQKTQIGWKNLILLLIKLKQFPIFFIENNYTIEETNLELRKKIFHTNFKKKNLENFIKKNLAFLIPKNYLENFNSIQQSINNSYWPKKTKLIINGNDDWYNDYFKIWAADQKFRNDAKYILTQHGGNVGTVLINSTLDTQIDIADKYLTWGWKRNKKTIPFYSLLTSNNFKSNYKNEKKIYFFQQIFDKYFNALTTVPLSMEDKINNYNLSNDLYKGLKTVLKKNFILRYLGYVASGKDYYFKYVNHYMKKDKGEKKFLDIINKARICIHDQQSTTFFETMRYNIPTLLILKKGYMKTLSREAKTCYKELEKRNIIFTNLKSIINFINKNYDSIDEWWENKNTQRARINFCNKFARRTNTPVTSFFNLIKKI